MLQELNSKWCSLQQLTAERAVQLGSAHEVQRFHRDVDETKDWIAEKEAALATDDLGKDLRSVQTLQRMYPVCIVTTLITNERVLRKVKRLRWRYPHIHNTCKYEMFQHAL